MCVYIYVYIYICILTIGPTPSWEPVALQVLSGVLKPFSTFGVAESLLIQAKGIPGQGDIMGWGLRDEAFNAEQTY